MFKLAITIRFLIPFEITKLLSNDCCSLQDEILLVSVEKIARIVIGLMNFGHE